MSHFANIIARVGHRPQESGLFFRGQEAHFNNAPLLNPGRILNSACRIYIPNGSLWNWERSAPREGAEDDDDGDGAATSFSIRRIQSRNLSIHYSVIP